MDANRKITIFNKGASIATVSYNNWDESTSRSVKINGGEKLVTYNWYEVDPVSPGSYVAVYENIFNYQVEPNEESIVLTNFGYNRDQITIKIESGTWSA